MPFLLPRNLLDPGIKPVSCTAGGFFPTEPSGKPRVLWHPGTKQPVCAQGQSWPDWTRAGETPRGWVWRWGQWPDGLGLSLDHPVSSAAGGFVPPPAPRQPPASCPAGTMLSLLSEVCAVLEEVTLEGVIHSSAEHSAWDSVCCVLSRVQLFAPTRLPCPWNSPGKTAGVACHFLLLGQCRRC